MKNLILLTVLFAASICLTKNNAEAVDKAQVSVVFTNADTASSDENPLRPVITALVDKIEQKLKDKEPEWKLDGKEIVTVRSRVMEGTALANLFWKSSKQYVEVVVFIERSKQDAIKNFQNSTDKVSKGIRTKLSNLGDDANMVTVDTNEDTYTNLSFVKNNIRVTIYTSNTKLAKRFAQSIESQIE